MALLDVAETADLLRQPGNLDGEGVIVHRQTGKQLFNRCFVFADQSPLGPAFGGTAENVEPSTAQRFHSCEQTQYGPDPGTERSLPQLTGDRIAAAE